MSIVLVSGPMIVEDGKVLLVKDEEKAIWKTCGGTVEDFSTDLKTNAAREAKEEVGIDLIFENREPFFVYVKKGTGEELKDIILVHFLARRKGEVTPGFEVTEYAWFPMDQLPSDLAPNIRPALKYFGF